MTKLVQKSSCANKCNCVADCNCPPNPCNPSNVYHDMYCPGGNGIESCSTAGSCGSLGCKCYMINMEVSSTPAIITAVGSPVVVTYRIQNVGNLPLCGQILVCDSKLGKTVLSDRRDTFLPVMSIVTIRKTYITTVEDFLTTAVNFRSRAYIHACGVNWVRSSNVLSNITIGGGDLDVFATQVVGTVANTASLTVTFSALFATSVVPVTGATLVLPFPAALPDDAVITVVSGNVVVDAVARTVTLSAPTLAIGASNTFTFTYPTEPATTYNWSGIATTTTFDPNQANNLLNSTLVIPALP